MNADHGGTTVDVLKKQFESFQICDKPVHGVVDGRHEKNANKRIIKRTPAFRNDVNVSRKLVDHSQTLAVTDSVKRFGNIINGAGLGKKTNKTEKPNQKSCLDLFSKSEKNNLAADQKALIQSLKKKLETDNAGGCKPKVPKKQFERTLKTPLPVGPPPKKPPRTFAHDKQIDTSDLPVGYTMESHTNSNSDPKIMLNKLEEFAIRNSHVYGITAAKTAAERDYGSKKSSKKSNLFTLAKSLENYHTDEQNYVTSKFYNENGTEHIYDEPIFLKPNSRLNNNSTDNCHELIGDECICDTKKSNHYMVNSEYQLK